MSNFTKKIASNFLQYRNLFFVVFTFCMVATLSFFMTSHARHSSAANLSSFQPGNIISDAVMANYNAMSEQDIQNFLNSKNKCDNRDYNLYLQYTSSKPNITWHWEGEPYNGHFVCLAEERFGETSGEIGTGKTAARIIYEAAQKNRINPQILLVLLQKESSLITDKVPNSFDYGQATGYGCPDTAACDKKYAGFSNQVHRAAELFRYVLDHNSVYYPAGRTVYVGYHPNANCGGTQVYIENRATAALYQYTPYQPNAAALAAGYGQGNSCSAYGNRNFYLYFTDWFGSTQAAIDGELVDVPDGTYTLISDLSEQRILGASSRNAELANASSATHWTIKRDSNGLYELIDRSTSLLLSVDQSQPESGTNVSVRSVSTDCAKKWKIYQTSDGALTFESSCNGGFVLDVTGGSSASGTNIQTYITNASPSQKWHLRASQTLVDGVYTINSSLGQNTLVDVAGGGTHNGTNIQIYENNHTLSQKWLIQYDYATGYYTITNPLSNKSIDVSYGNIKNGTNIWLYEQNRTCSQQWNIIESAGRYVISSACSPLKAIEVKNKSTTNGANIQLQAYDRNNLGESWNIIKSPEPSDGTYTIRTHLDDDQLLEAANGNVQLYQSHDDRAQQWTIKKSTTSGYYTITDKTSNQAIDITYGDIRNNTNIWLYDHNNTCSQQWYIIESRPNYYTIFSSCVLNYTLDVTYGDARSGTNIQLYKSNGTLSQEWYFAR